ncbi:hypothetical protein K8Q62_23280 [Klebsiella pneumoniae]
MDLKSARVCVVVATNEKRLREFGSSSSQRKEKLKFLFLSENEYFWETVANSEK